MDGQVTAGTLVCAIPTHAVSDWLAKKMVEFCQTPRPARTLGKMGSLGKFAH